MAKGIHKPNTMVRIVTGLPGKGKDDFPRALQFGIPEIYRGGKWITHPDWKEAVEYEKGIPITGATRFMVEFVSDVLDYSFQSHLACYTSHKVADKSTMRPFCFRAHRGPDGIGVATRRHESGAMLPVECDPVRCALRQQSINPGSQDEEIMRDYTLAYPGGNFKSGKTVVGCKAYNFLVFRLLKPDLSGYAHPDGELAYIATHSEVTHDRLRKKLRRLFADCNGHIKGVRMLLVFRPFASAHKKAPTTPAWDLEHPEGETHALMLEAAKRRQSLNYDEMAAKCTDAESTALVLADKQNYLTRWEGDDEAEVDEVIQAAHRQIDQEDVDASYIAPGSVTLVNQHPTVKALADRLNRNYAKQVRYSMDFTDPYKCIKALVEHNEGLEEKIWIDDIINASEYAGAFGGRDARPNDEVPTVGEVRETTTGSDTELCQDGGQERSVPEGDVSQADEAGAADEEEPRSTEEVLAASAGKTTEPVDAEYTEVASNTAWKSTKGDLVDDSSETAAPGVSENAGVNDDRTTLPGTPESPAQSDPHKAEYMGTGAGTGSMFDEKGFNEAMAEEGE